MSWPAVRTVPGTAGAWPHVLGCLVVLIVLPAVSYLLVWPWAARLAVGEGTAAPFWLQMQLMRLPLSPLRLWQGLCLGVPLAALALRRGWAGWAMALAVGTAIQPIVDVVLPALLGIHALLPLSPARQVLVDLQLSPPGALFGLAYWLGLRLAAPHLVRCGPGNGAASAES